MRNVRFVLLISLGVLIALIVFAGVKECITAFNKYQERVVYEKHKIESAKKIADDRLEAERDEKFRIDFEVHYCVKTILEHMSSKAYYNCYERKVMLDGNKLWIALDKAGVKLNRTENISDLLYKAAKTYPDIDLGPQVYTEEMKEYGREAERKCEEALSQLLQDVKRSTPKK